MTTRRGWLENVLRLATAGLALALQDAGAVRAAADSRCPRLNPGEGFNELNAVIDCLERKIDARKGDGPSASPAAPAPADGSEFDAGSFTMSIFGASRSAGWVSLSLIIRNKTQEPLLIAMDQRELAVLADDAGGTVKINGYPQGLKIVDPLAAAAKSDASYTPIQPNRTMNTGLQFVHRGTAAMRFVLTVHLLTEKAESFTKHAATVSFALKDAK